MARGVCVTKRGYLRHLDERTKICWKDGKIAFTEDDGETWTEVPKGTPVSMNLFGFTPSIITELNAKFPAALEKILAENPIKGEFYIPIVTSELVAEGKARVKVLPAHDRWYGVTYKEDHPAMVQAMREKIDAGEYPEDLWK